jgi:hypothetical protein
MFRAALTTALIAAPCAAAIAGCGGSSKPSGSAKLPNAAAIAYSKCMRANGVSNFPDPSPGGTLQLSPALKPGSPSFQAAQKACVHLMPGAVAVPKMSASQRRAAIRFAACMRRNGVSSFPDPGQASAANPGAPVLVIRGMQFSAGLGAIDPRSPAFRHAAHACGINPPGTARTSLNQN